MYFHQPFKFKIDMPVLPSIERYTYFFFNIIILPRFAQIHSGRVFHTRRAEIVRKIVFPEIDLVVSGIKAYAFFCRWDLGLESGDRVHHGQIISLV